MGFKARPNTQSETDLKRMWSRLRSTSLRMKGSREDFPWGETVVKVGSKVFVFLGRPSDDSLSFSVKLADSADDVLALPYASPTGHGLGRSGWVTLRFEAKDVPDFGVLKGWIEESYRSIAGARAK